MNDRPEPSDAAQQLGLQVELHDAHVQWWGQPRPQRRYDARITRQAHY